MVSQSPKAHIRAPSEKPRRNGLLVLAWGCWFSDVLAGFLVAGGHGFWRLLHFTCLFCIGREPHGEQLSIFGEEVASLYRLHVLAANRLANCCSNSSSITIRVCRSLARIRSGLFRMQ